MFLLIFLINDGGLRGIWIPRWSIEKHEQIFNVIDGRFNHIFLQILGSGEAYYSSELAPIRKKDDQWLKEFLREAHLRGIRVSAWINIFYFWGYAPRITDKKHPINFAPDWFVSDKGQRSILDYTPKELKNMNIEGYYLAPGHRSVRIYLMKIIEEIIQRYDFDGIHLDYIRYPGQDFIYDVHLRTKFQRRYYYDPIIFEDDSLNIKLGIEGVNDLYRRWCDFVSDDLTEFVKELKSRIKAIKPECAISAAVKPDYTIARNDFYQDWLNWVNNGYVDFVCLMAYTEDIQKIIDKTLRNVRDPSRVAIGLGIYNLTPEVIKKQIGMINRTPFLGFVYFSYEQLKENRIYLNLISH